MMDDNLPLGLDLDHDHVVAVMFIELLHDAMF